MQNKNIQRWRWLYFGLALLDIIALGASLLSNHHLGAQYSQTVEINEFWAERLKAFEDLQILASNVNAPGNDVFDSKNVVNERKRLELALKSYNQLYDASLASLKNNQDRFPLTEVIKHYEKIRVQMTEILRETGLIFEHFANNRERFAASRMATMDRKSAELRLAIISCSQKIRKIQSDFLQEQKVKGEKLRSFELLFSLFIVIMILSMLAYGTTLSRFISETLDTQTSFKEQTHALNSSAIVGITDSRGKIIYANDKFIEITGYARDELIGKDHRVLNSNHHSKVFFEDLWKTISSGSVWRGELKNRKKDGTFYWVDSTIVPMRNRNGKIHQYIAIRYDISERKRVEDKLDMALEASNMAVWSFDLDTKKVWRSNQHDRIFGYEKQVKNWTGETFFSHVYEEDRAKVINEFENENGPAPRVLCRIKRHDNQKLRWIEIITKTVKESAGRKGRLIGTIRDVTQQVKIDNELIQAKNDAEESRKQIELLLEIADIANRSKAFGDAIHETLRVVSVNMDMLIGHAYWVDEEKTDQLVSSKKWYLKRPEKFQVFKDVSEISVFKSGIGLPGRVWATNQAHWIDDVTKDANFPRNRVAADIDVHSAFAFPVLIGQQTVAVLEFFTDKIMEKNDAILSVASQFGLHLGQAFERERSAILLKKERDAAQIANKTKASFLANISHEIRTPMNGIIGMTSLLLSSITDAVQLEKLKIIQNCGNSLLDLINDVLDFSKLEADKIELDSVSFKLAPEVNEIVELLTHKATEKQVALSYRQEPSVPECLAADVTKVRQILTNLISNAIKFTNTGRVEISSSAEEKSENLWQIRFSVKDTGIGIPESVKSKLFQSFSQVDASTTRRFGGTGLGLAICKGLCEKMGGTIWVESESGRGSTFSFTFLAEKAELETTKRTADPFLKFDSEMAKKHPLRILIAEDNRTNQLVVKGFLERLGYHADLADNGEEALQKLNQASYDLILMDCHMPKMDGFEATKQVISKYGDKRPRIIALTASTTKEDIDHCFQVGMDGFIGKPISIAALAQNLSACRPAVLEKAA